MKISDLYIESGVGSYLGIFYSISNRLHSQDSNSNTYKYLNKMVGGNTNSVNLDSDYHLNYSTNKNVSILVENVLKGEDPSTEYNGKLASIILSRFFDKWEHIITTMQLEYNVIENYSMVESETTSNSGESSSSSSGGSDTSTESEIVTSTSTEHLRTGYNDTDTYNKDNKDVNDSSVTQDPTKNKISNTTTTEDSSSSSGSGERELTRSGNIGVTTSQQMIESELKLREFNINKMMYDDIDKILTSRLYVY